MKAKINATNKFSVFDKSSLKGIYYFFIFFAFYFHNFEFKFTVNHTVKREITRLNKEKGERIDDSGLIGGEFDPTAFAKYQADRLNIFEKYWQESEEAISLKPKNSITITLPSGDIKTGVSFTTTPYDVAKTISQGLADSIVIAKVFYFNKVEDDQVIACDEDEEATSEQHKASSSEVEGEGELWDLQRPLIGDCKLKLLKYDDPEAKIVFWHSSAHILGAAIEATFGAHLTIGPPIQSGFYYDSYMGNKTVHDEDFKKIESTADLFCKKKNIFQRLVLSKNQALKMFENNPFKVSLITNKVPDGAKTTVYRCGDFIDLCMGPHLSNTGFLIIIIFLILCFLIIYVFLYYVF
jgi:threonyl-tRNA synthetase